MQRQIIAVLTALLSGCGTLDGSETPTSADVSAGSSDGGASRGRRDENFECRGTFTGSFSNVFVPERATCTLRAAHVSGNVLARDGAELFVSDTRVDGNIDGVEAAIVLVRGGIVHGSIQIQDGDSRGELGAGVFGTILTQGNIQIQKMRTGQIVIDGAELRKGNIKVEANHIGTALEIAGNYVAQNLQVFNNEGAGAKNIAQNRVRQILQCKENRNPFTGGPNRAAEAEDQCF